MLERDMRSLPSDVHPHKLHQRSMMTNFLRKSLIPLEVCEEILKILGDDDPDLEPRRNSTLINCALTCRSWYPSSIRNLLRRVAIQKQEYLNKFTALITEKLQFRDAVKTLIIRGDHTSTHSIVPAFPAILARKLPAVQSLQLERHRSSTANWSKAPFHTSFSLLLREFSTITELSLKDIEFHSITQFAQLIHSFPLLRTLYCESLTWPSVTYTPILHQFGELERLANLEIIVGDLTRTEELINWINFSSPTAPLERIRLHSTNRQSCTWALAMNRLLQTAGSDLRELTLDNLDFSDSSRNALTHFLGLSSNSRLQSLILSISLWEGTTPVHLTGWIPRMLSQITSHEVFKIEITIRGLLYPHKAVEYEQLQLLFKTLGCVSIDTALSAPQFASLRSVRFTLAAPQRIPSISTAMKPSALGDVEAGVRVDGLKPRCYWNLKELFIARMPRLHARGILQVECDRSLLALQGRLSKRNVCDYVQPPHCCWPSHAAAFRSRMPNQQ